MKRLILLFFFFASIFLQNASAREALLESKIQKADEYWKSNRLSQVIEQYQLIIDKEIIPDEYKSLVYLRLAEAQFQAKHSKDCRETLSKAKKLPVLPAHHQLKIQSLSGQHQQPKK